MSVFSSIYKHTLGRVFIHKTSQPTNPRKRKLEENNAGDNEPTPRRRKREDSEEHQDVISKRRRVDADHFAPIVDGQAYESTAIEGPSASEQMYVDSPTVIRQTDRFLMPPPALVLPKAITKKNESEGDHRRTTLDFEGASQLSMGTKATQQRTSEEFLNDYNMEKARRHAAATTLPPHSGVWERGEKELFYHLSYRGFEPLFPRNWMKDFPTMPLSLYEAEDDEQPPLIRVYKPNGEFRAIRELRAVLDVGKAVRDKVLSSPAVKKEAVIEKALKKYLSWALHDAGIKPSPSTGSSSTTKQETSKPALKGIKTAIKRPESDREQTWIAESSEDDLPVLYGVMICKSLLAIFTLNSRTPEPSTVRRAGFRLSPAASESVYGGPAEVDLVETEIEDDTASDPRFISDFDFSDPAKDVWNALVIAIVAMQIRRDMLLLARGRGADGLLEDVCDRIEEASIMDLGDDPDA